MQPRGRNPFLGARRPGANAVTRVCLVGADDVDLRAALLDSETARDALSSYAVEEPYANCVAVETISIGAAVSLLNDLNWYLRRYADDALVLEPSVSREEWLSRALATAVRNERIEPADTGTFLKIYGVVEPDAADDEGSDAGDEGASGPGSAAGDAEAASVTESDDTADEGPLALAEPLLARRVGGETPAYDLREVVDTLVVRVTAEEFGA